MCQGAGPLLRRRHHRPRRGSPTMRLHRYRTEPDLRRNRVQAHPGFDDPVEGVDDAFGRQGEIDLDAESLTVVVVDHIEQSDASAVGQLVMHEVHRPGVVDLCRHGQRQRLFPHQPMAWLDPQVQFQFAIDPVDALVVPFKPLHVAQIQEAQAEAPVALVIGQAYQPVSHDSIFRVELGAIAIAGLANAKCLTGQSYGG